MSRSIATNAAFVANRTLAVKDGTISADRLVLATGSRPKRPALDVPYWTSDDVFKLRKMPKSITIVGGGYIACELGHFFHGVGVDTLLVVRRDQLLDREDNETRAIFMKGFHRPACRFFQLDDRFRRARRLGSSPYHRPRRRHGNPARQRGAALLHRPGSK